MFIKFITFILSPWWVKDPYSKYYYNRKRTVGYTFSELVSFLWIIPLVILSFGFTVSGNDRENMYKALFLGIFYSIVIVAVLEKSGILAGIYPPCN